MHYGCTSEVIAIRTILLKHPKDAFKNQMYINKHWKELNYSECPNYNKAVKEYDRFAEVLKRNVEEVVFLPEDEYTSLDSIYVRDAVLMTSKGAIICKMGKKQRENEPLAVQDFLKKAGIPIIGKITGNGKLEGGDIVLLDEKTIIVGEGYRTNAEGIRQLKEITSDFIKDVIVVPLPHWKGHSDVFHLMSIISPLDYDLAVVYSKLMPVFFRNWLIGKGIELIEVPDSEFETMGCNILAISPRKCLMLQGNPKTKRKLEENGVEVTEYEGNEISVKGAGGPTCLTRPIFRM